MLRIIQRFLRFIQSKTGVEVTLPLEPVVGNAIANYILHERPTTHCNALFVRSRAPHDAMTGTALGDRLRKHMRLTDVEYIPGNGKGFHSVVKYAEQTGMNISNDMVRAIEFKREYPWVLSFPFINSEVYGLMKEFHPYFYVMTDSSGYAVDSEILGQEVVFENHFQAFAHQICGHISPRCMDCGKVQCGFSYYGIKGCRYLLDGSCDGHVDRDSELPGIVLDENHNIVEGCLFEAFLNVMGVEVRDLVVTDISKRIDPDMFKKAN